MDKVYKSGLSRLVAWFRRSDDVDAAVPAEVTRSQSRLRRPPLVAGTVREGSARAERLHADPMHRDRPHADPTRKDRSRAEPEPVERAPAEPVQVEHSNGKQQVPAEHVHAAPPAHAEQGHGGPVPLEHGALAHADHGHGHGHGHDVLMAKGTGGRLELHGNTLHLTKGGLFGFFVGLIGLHGGHAHQTIRVSDISAIEFEKHGVFFHYVRFCYPGAPRESGNHLHDMMADNALLMSVFDNRALYRIKERIEQSMEAKIL